MKRYIILSFFALVASTVLLTAQPVDSVANLFAKANQLYKQEDYAEAADIYEELLKQGSSAELYYNLGNSYYKSHEIGAAILNYERALRLKPNFPNARYNLKIAEEKLIDNVSSAPSFWVRRFYNMVIQSLSSNGWAYISFGFLLTFLSMFLVFAFSRRRRMRKFAFNAAIVALTVFILSFSFSAVRKKQFNTHNQAIVMHAAVMVKSSPDKSGTDLFELHEGTKVFVKSTLEGWSEVKLDNGAVGWLESYTIERI